VAISEHEKRVITEFAKEELGVGIDCWPDEVNRDTKDIDALAGGSLFAIEHTSLDSFPNQRKRTAQSRRVTEGLEAELSPAMQFRLAISIHVSAIQVGQNWSEARESLKAWVLTESALLPDGRHREIQIPGLPFLVTVDKGGNPWKPKLVFWWPGSDLEFQPDDDQVRALLEGKASKLRRYSDGRKTTILLVESEDLQLMNSGVFCELMSRLFKGGRPPGVDQIWFADCAIPAEMLFHRCF
jgi:hypothetical protein